MSDVTEIAFQVGINGSGSSGLSGQHTARIYKSNGLNPRCKFASNTSFCPFSALLRLHSLSASHSF